jgi:hypothetical protein
VKRLFFGLLVALAIALIAGTAQTSAAPSTPAHGGGRGVGGQVSSVDGTTITVTTRGGTAQIATTSTTTFEINGASGSLSGITAGLFVRAEGSKATDGSFTATRVVASSTRPTPPNRPSV